MPVISKTMKFTTKRGDISSNSDSIYSILLLNFRCTLYPGCPLLLRGQPLTSNQFGFPSDIAGLTNLTGGGDDGPDGQEIVLVGPGGTWYVLVGLQTWYDLVGLGMTWWDLV